MGATSVVQTRFKARTTSPAFALAAAAPARHYQPELLKSILAGDINPGRVFDLGVDLDDIAEAYAAMDERRAIKALVRVSELA